MKVRIVSKGWETFTGSLGHRAVFKDGESVDELTARDIARIGSSLQIIDIETGEQVGPAATAAKMRLASVPVTTQLENKSDSDARAEAAAEAERERLIKEEEERKAKEEEALEAARLKAEEDAKAGATYTRQELEAVAANDGIDGLREIAKPLGVKGRGIGDLITEILNAQAKLAAE